MACVLGPWRLAWDIGKKGKSWSFGPQGPVHCWGLLGHAWPLVLLEQSCNLGLLEHQDARASLEAWPWGLAWHWPGLELMSVGTFLVFEDRGVNLVLGCAWSLRLEDLAWHWVSLGPLSAETSLVAGFLGSSLMTSDVESRLVLK